MKLEQDNAVLNQIALEVRALEDLFSKETVAYHNTAQLLGKPWYGLALESNQEDEQKDQANKGKVIQRILETIVNFIKRILSSIVKFFTGYDSVKEEARRKRANEIWERRKEVDFVKTVMERLPGEVKVVICAIEENSSFSETFDRNIKLDRTITITKHSYDHGALVKNRLLAERLEEGINTLQEYLRAAAEENAYDRDAHLLRSLRSGISINGSENGDYLKAFATTKDVKKKYEDLLEVVEKFQKTGVEHEVIEGVQKVASVLSKQFSMEVKVFTTYTKLNQTIISVNEQVYGKSDGN